MREILFRGKRMDNGEWVEGDLRRGGYIENDPSTYIVALLPGSKHTYINWPVGPETIGQYTGLTANGKKVFEGDILAHWSEEREKYAGECVVKYGEFNCSCCDGVYGWYLVNGDIRFVGEDDKYYEVIGNVHDNPELLEVDNG